jgi:hypothetical protein
LNVVAVLNGITNLTSYLGNGLISPFKATSYNTSEGFRYTQLLTEDSTYMLASCSDSNISAQEYSTLKTLSNVGCGNLWSYEVKETGAAIMADGSGSVLHFYPNTMDKLGISRQRSADMRSTPKESQYISFTPIDNGDRTYIY